MKRRRLLATLATRVYPAAWWDRYGVEFEALLDETKPGWRNVVDVLNGGLQMRLEHTGPALTMAAFSLVGAVGAGAMAFSTAERFASTATLSVRLAVPSTAADAARLEDLMPRLAREAFSRDFLTGIVQKHDLYHNEAADSSADELVNRAREDIGVQRISPSVVQVSFAAAEARKARLVTVDLVSQLVSANLQAGLGSIVQVLDRPDEPRRSVRPRRVAVAGLTGLGGGALIGILLGWRRRRPSQPDGVSSQNQ
jgi:hypothetical protein